MDHILADGVLVDICLGLLPELDVAAASRSTQRSKPRLSFSRTSERVLTGRSLHRRDAPRLRDGRRSFNQAKVEHLSLIHI